jgi:N utilization substance protein B
MSSRRRGREIALQILCLLERQPELNSDDGLTLYFQHLLGSDLDVADGADGEPGDAAITSAVKAAKVSPSQPLSPALLELRRFVEELVHGVYDHQAELDSLLSRCSRNWRLARMSWVDRNLLRLACYELVFALGTPVRVILHQAIELARRYSTSESPGFVNGVLDRAMREAGRADAPPAPSPAQPSPEAGEHAAG